VGGVGLPDRGVASIDDQVAVVLEVELGLADLAVLTVFSAIDDPAYASAVQAAGMLPGTEGCAKWAEAEEALIKNVEIVPFVDASVPTFATGAEFELSQGSVQPASIRMLA
jgi:hypothetical protein